MYINLQLEWDLHEDPVAPGRAGTSSGTPRRADQQAPGVERGGGPAEGPTGGPTGGPAGSPTGSPAGSLAGGPAGDPTRGPIGDPTGGPAGGPGRDPGRGTGVSGVSSKGRISSLNVHLVSLSKKGGESLCNLFRRSWDLSTNLFRSGENLSAISLWEVGISPIISSEVGRISW